MPAGRRAVLFQTSGNVLRDIHRDFDGRPLRAKDGGLSSKTAACRLQARLNDSVRAGPGGMARVLSNVIVARFSNASASCMLPTCDPKTPSANAVALRVQLIPIAGQLFNVVVDRVGQILVRNAGPLAEDQAVPRRRRSSSIGGNGSGAHLIAPPGSGLDVIG